MSRSRRSSRVSLCAPAALTVCLSVAVFISRACADGVPDLSDVVVLSPASSEALADDYSALAQLPIELQQPDGLHAAAEELPPDADFADEFAGSEWGWQWLPQGVIYHSYMAGVHEPRTAIVASQEAGRWIWDPTLGGRVGLLRYGDWEPLRPQGFELDFYGAAIARLDVDHRQDLDSTDYVFGFPLTYGVGDTQYKFGYAHLSSHMGDELVIREPGRLDERVNYVRDSLVLGMSHYPCSIWRMYGEMGWAFNADGGAKPWEGQFGTELSRPGPTGRHGTPFFAVNGRMRQEHNYGGDLTAQVGWLRRGDFGQTLRVGAQYYNGKSSQSQFFNTYEQQIGMGLWYDF